MICPDHVLEAVFVPHVALYRVESGFARAYAPFWCCPRVSCSWEVSA